MYIPDSHVASANGPLLKSFLIGLIRPDHDHCTICTAILLFYPSHLLFDLSSCIRVTGATVGCHGTGNGSRRAPVPIGPSLSPHLFSDILDLSSFYSGLRCSGHLHLSLCSLFCTSHLQFFTMTRAKLHTAVTLLFLGWVAIC
jgi:hypothetical protein